MRTDYDKLVEEAKEVVEAKTMYEQIEEMADLLEVFHVLRIRLGIEQRSVGSQNSTENEVVFITRRLY